MNILFITTKSPWPMNDGHSLRSYNLLKQVAFEHAVHLLSFVKYQEEKLEKTTLEEICRSVQLIDVPANRSPFSLAWDVAQSFVCLRPVVVQKYNTFSMREAIRSVLAREEIDLVHLDMLPLACYLDELRGYPVLLNEHNIESLLLARKAKHIKNIFVGLFFTLQAKWLSRFEQKAVAGVDYVIACSTHDSVVLREVTDSTPITTVPNGVDTEYFAPTLKGDSGTVSLVFVGGLNWYPNRDALQWFDECIFPLVLTELPGIKLHVIGQSIDIAWRHRENILCHGSVPDVRPFMNQSVVFIVPLRIGGGTRLKILNAMAMEIAVVSTTVGAEGLQVIDQEDICLADQEQDFAEAVIRLAKDAEERQRMGGAARRTILDNYTWDSIGVKIRQVYGGMLQEHHGN